MAKPCSTVAGPRRAVLQRVAPVPLLCVALLGAGGSPASGVPAAAGASAPTATAGGFRRFDSLVTAETVFPDNVQRQLYRVLPPVTDHGRRSYAFQLLAQPGMDPVRHFQLVTVTWARGGQLTKAPDTCASPGGAGGPGGGFADACAQTADRAWDVRVTLGSLLPDSVRAPDFDVSAAAANMVRLYQAR